MEMNNYWVEVLDVNEAKVRGNSVRMIGDTMCMHSGVQGGRAKVGAAILLSEGFGRFFKEWKCVDELSLCFHLRIQGAWVPVLVVQVYTHTKECDASSKYEILLRLRDSWESDAW